MKPIFFLIGVFYGPNNAALLKIMLFMLQGFQKKSLSDFVYAINLKSEPFSSMPNSMPMVSVIFLVGRFWDQDLCQETKCLHKTLVMKNKIII